MSAAEDGSHQWDGQHCGRTRAWSLTFQIVVLSLTSPPEGQAGGFRKSWGGWTAPHPPSCLVRSPDFADDTSDERRSFYLEWKVLMTVHEVAAAAGATSVVTQVDSPVCMEGASQLWGILLLSAYLSM